MHYVHRYRTQILEKIVAFFIFFSLIFLLLIFFFVGKKKGMFEQDYRIRTLLNEGYGLTPGTVVKLAGIEVGRVESVGFNPENKVEVVMKIRKKFKEKIRINSIVSISREGLAGEKFLNITLGSVDSPILGDGDRILAHPALEISDLADKITPTIENIEKISNNLVQITEKLASPTGELATTLKSIQDITNDLRQGKGSLGSLIRDDKRLYKDLEAVLKLSRKIAKNLEDTTASLKSSAAETPKTVEKINATVDETKKLVEDARKVVDAAKKHWLIRGYVAETEKKEEVPKEEKKVEKK